MSACRPLRSCASALEVELQACIVGARLAKEWSEDQIILESDNLEVVRIIHDPGVNRTQLAMLVNEAKRLCQDGRVYRVEHVRPEMNTASHSLV